MHLVTKNIASSPRQHDDIAALEGANGRISLLDFKNAASLNHDQEGDILAVRRGGVSPGSREGMDAGDQPVATNRVEHILQHVNGHAFAPPVEISGRMRRRSGRMRCDSSISPCYTIAQEYNKVYPDPEEVGLSHEKDIHMHGEEARIQMRKEKEESMAEQSIPPK